MLLGPGECLFVRCTQNPTSKNGNVIHDEVTFSDNGGNLYREPRLLFAQLWGGPLARPEILPHLMPILYQELVIRLGPDMHHLFWVVSHWLFTIVRTNINGTSDSSTGHLCFMLGRGLLDGGMAILAFYFTYRLQYQDSGGQWVTYDTKYGRTTYGLFSFRNAHQIYRLR